MDGFLPLPTRGRQGVHPGADLLKLNLCILILALIWRIAWKNLTLSSWEIGRFSAGRQTPNFKGSSVIISLIIG